MAPAAFADGPAPGWADGRAARVRRLEAALAAAERRAATGPPPPGPDRGCGFSSDESGHSSDGSGSASGGEGRPLLRAYRPAERPRGGAGAGAAAAPKQPEQYLPWGARIRDALRRACCGGHQ
ncbi:hypothetical protein H4R18_005234 [Coemansia javaensis]|uniref:Uncharacterized protein n=1 Tax=Coemansia javaensis TaxID=2761396 RepID=A0A9W8H8D7_9FUNG|nr:hypothetical protein H4R18_005234 [Coemansia javaensis]